MRTGRWIMVVLGSLLALAGFGLLLGSAAVGIGQLGARGDDGFFTTPTERFETDTHAITSEPISFTELDDLPGFLGPDDLGRVRVQATSGRGGTDLFVGIGPTEQVEEYLGDVARAEVTRLRFNPFSVRYRTLDGGAPPAPPAEEDLWSASAVGGGLQEVVWDATDGEWTLVVMNADGRADVVADVSLGARFDLLGPVAIGLAVGGIVFLLVGVPLLVAGAVGLASHRPPPPAGPPTVPAGASVAGPTAGVPTPPGTDNGPTTTPTSTAASRASYPARLVGRLDAPLSRWLWLVKWLLAIPHAIVLAFLWLALVVLTVVAGVAILVTGRYPRGIFDFNVGVVRWTWRVGFYAYSALGTDRYPPFTLARTDHPADFEVAYPERLSRGLVLVKWWLLAIPHLLIVAVLGGGIGGFVWSADEQWSPVIIEGGGLIGLLTVVAGFFLLIVGRYPRELFDFVMGLNRWVYRVVAYVLLMRPPSPR